MIGTLAADGWAFTFGTAMTGLGGLQFAVPYGPSMASVPTSHYSMWHYNYLCTVKGQTQIHVIVQIWLTSIKHCTCEH